MIARIRLLLSGLVMLSALTAAPGAASAQLLVTSDVRCTNGYITSTQATARYQWARYCHDHLPMAPVGMTYSPDQWLTAQSIMDHDNPANATIRDRLYPVYFNMMMGTIWSAPDSATTACSVRPNSAPNVGLCVSGCYVAGTQLRFAEGPVDIKLARERGQLNLVTLAPTATLDNLQTVTNKVKSYTTDLEESWQTIYTLTMRSGGTLRVTDEHPLLTSDGVIRQARSLKVGNQLVRDSGQPDPIARIEVNKMFGRVYNVKPVTTDYTSNLLIAGGYINGSVRYQNEFLDTVNSLILRRALTQSGGWRTTP